MSAQPLPGGAHGEPSVTYAARVHCLHLYWSLLLHRNFHLFGSLTTLRSSLCAYATQNHDQKSAAQTPAFSCLSQDWSGGPSVLSLTFTPPAPSHTHIHTHPYTPATSDFHTDEAIKLLGYGCFVPQQNYLLPNAFPSPAPLAPPIPPCTGTRRSRAREARRHPHSHAPRARAPYVPQETAIADDTTTPLAHGVRQGVAAEEQLPEAQWGHGAQPVSPVGGRELFHLQRLHPSSGPQLRPAPRPSA